MIEARIYLRSTLNSYVFMAEDVRLAFGFNLRMNRWWIIGSQIRRPVEMSQYLTSLTFEIDEGVITLFKSKQPQIRHLALNIILSLLIHPI